MPTVEIIDHKSQAENLLLSQFKDSPNINALILSWLTPVQELEDALLDFVEGNGITVAVGVMLDIIGSWMGVERDGLTDDEYRTAILSEALLETMDGTTEKFLEGLRVLTDSTQVKFFNYYPNDVYAVSGKKWNGTLKASAKKIANVTANINMLIARDLNYLVPAIRGAEENFLSNEDDVDYEIMIDGILYPWQVSYVDSAEAYGTSSVCGWSGYSFTNEASSAFHLVDFKVVSGLIVDNNGNVVIDEQGTPVSYLNQILAG